MTPLVVRSTAQLRTQVGAWKVAGQRIGVVPTMGALHAGHLSLVRAAREAADRVIVTIFVNPKQFNNPDDLQKYPRTEDRDAEKLRDMGVDVVYAPTLAHMYPDGFSTNISISGISDGLCGAHRPGHFDGVATVVCKLLLQTRADSAFFGEKDYQQLQIVRRLVADLDIPTTIVGGVTVRDSDGLALSSRNVHLTAANRQIAPVLYRALKAAAGEIESGRDVTEVLRVAIDTMRAAGIGQVEYLELRDVNRFERVTKLTAPARLLVAAVLGDVRLIDNIAVGEG